MTHVNAKITDTMLGYEDRGIMTYSIQLEMDGSGIAIGGYQLGGAYTDKVVQGLLKAVGVDHWEQLKGKLVRLEFEGDGPTWGKPAKRIGHIIEDKWFNPANV